MARFIWRKNPIAAMFVYMSIVLPLIAPVLVADRSIVEAEALISTAYAGQLLRPQVSLSVRATPLKVFVGGEVDKPGVYDMPGDINALQAVIMAGGFKTSAKRDRVVIIRRGPAGRAIRTTSGIFSWRSIPRLSGRRESSRTISMR